MRTLEDGQWATVPVAFAGVLRAGTYTFGTYTGFGGDLGEGNDYSGMCSLTVLVDPAVGLDYAENTPDPRAAIDFPPHLQED